jgi:hypothetical protein
MPVDIVLKLAITPHFDLLIDKEDGTEPEHWKLCLDYRALAHIEDETGLDLKEIKTWFDGKLTSKVFPTIVHGTLRRFNPDVTLDHVLDILSPGMQRPISDALIELCFPGITERTNKALAEKKETGASADPNVPTVETTATS